MNQKNQRGSGNGGGNGGGPSEPVDPKKWKASQYFQLATVAFEPLVTYSLKPGELLLLQFLTYRAWQKKNLIVKASGNFITRNTGFSASTIKRHCRKLVRLRLLRKEPTVNKRPNLFLVEPILLAEFLWKTLPLKHLEESELYRMVQSGPSGKEEIGAEIRRMVQNGPSDGLKRTIDAQMARTRLVQNGPQYYLLYSLLLADGAGRHSSTDKTAGGEDVSPTHPTSNKRSPAGQDHTPNRKGVGLTADNFQKRRAELQAQLRLITD